MGTSSSEKRNFGGLTMTYRIVARINMHNPPIVGCISSSMILCCCMNWGVGGFIVGCISSSMILCCCMNWGVGGFIVGCISCIVGCISRSILCCWMNWGAGGCIVGCMNDSFGGCFGGCMGVSLVGVGVFFRHLLRRVWNQNWD